MFSAWSVGFDPNTGALVPPGSWRMHIQGLDAALPSVLVHMMIYLSSLAAPFPLLRFPNYLGPALYCASMCYQLLVSPLMLFVALSLDGRGTLPHTELWVLLLVAVSLALLGIGLMACYMVPEKRPTFYKVRTKQRKPCAQTEVYLAHIHPLSDFPRPPAQVVENTRGRALLGDARRLRFGHRTRRLQS